MEKQILKTGLLFYIFQISLFATSSISLYDKVKYDENFTNFDYVNREAPKGGDIILGASGTFDSLNPFILKGISADDIYLIYDTLMVKSLDEVSSLYPLLAKDINLSKDFKSAIFTLNENAKWSDGENVSSEDVKFTFETLLKDGSPAYKSYLSGIEEIEILDLSRVKFIFSESSGKDIVTSVATTEILPKHFWEKHDFKNSPLQIPVGSGPYKIDRFRTGHSLKFMRRDDYWGKNLPVNIGKYNFNSIKYDYYRDENVLFEAFKSLNYHFRLENISKNWATEYSNLGDNFVVEELKHNLPQGIQGFFYNTRRDKFKDLRVRKAIALAFDFEWTNKNLFYNQYKRSESFFSNSDFGVDDFHLPKGGGSYEIRPNLREAMRLLKESGCYLENGKLFFQNGERVSFEMLLYSNGFVRVVLPFERNLQKLGIEMKIKLVDQSQYISRLRKFDFDVVVSSRGQQIVVGSEQFAYWHSKDKDLEGSLNIIGIANDEVDLAIENISLANNIEEIKKASKELDKLLLKGFYTIPHWHIDKFRVAYWKKLQHPKTPPYGLNFESWWFKD